MTTPESLEAKIDEVLKGFIDPYVATLPEGKQALKNAKQDLLTAFSEAIDYVIGPEPARNTIEVFMWQAQRTRKSEVLKGKME